MDIAVVKPAYGKHFFATDVTLFDTSVAVINRMLDATQVDVQKMLVAKGFTVAGAYDSVDEMTFQQKQRASLVLIPSFSVDLTVTGANSVFSPHTGTVSGSVLLEMREPMSREKVWIKRLDLPPTTATVTMDAARINNAYVPVITTNSLTALLNEFYPVVMQKIWDHLDPVELQSLKRDADKLKNTTQYRGG